MFMQRLVEGFEAGGSPICVGLDPELERLPRCVRDRPDAIFAFNKAIIDATADLVCAFKPQVAYYSAAGAEDQLVETIRYIRRLHANRLVILDAKRGDIGSTAEMYAREAFERYDADAVTVNPYMGADAVEPFITRKDRGVFILCRTSNPSGGTFQDLLIDGQPLYQRVALEAAEKWNGHGNVGLVVGATYPTEMRRLRSLVGNVPFLVPGVGSQGASLATALSHGADERGHGLIISSSRAVIYASADDDFADAARRAVSALQIEAEQVRSELRTNVVLHN